MRIVLDTNVLVAAFIAHGSCSELLEYCIVHHEVILSPFILEELRDVLTRKFGFKDAEGRSVIRLLQTRTGTVMPAPLPSPICRDPADDQIIAAARTARCAAIVTGDKDLLALRRVGGIRIVAPADFWKFEAENVKLR
jgi:putative PIN family toxin of toxin-antitoxin system